MSVWAIADTHLAFSAPERSMEIFGSPWVGYVRKLNERWRECVKADDLVLLPGDISWATKPADVVPDLEWLDALPGKKVMIRGNHDYWWPSSRIKLQRLMPPSIHALQHDAWQWGDVAICGTRLWDAPDVDCNSLVAWRGKGPAKRTAEDDRIFQRELVRLQEALAALVQLPAARRICLTHYPPINPDLSPSAASRLIEASGVHFCLFGHLHCLHADLTRPLFGQHNGTQYMLTSSDDLDFRPLKIMD